MKQMTYDELKDACLRRLPWLRAMPAHQFNMPRVLQQVAEDMFRRGVAGDDWTAHNVRLQLNNLATAGQLRFEDGSTIEIEREFTIRCNEKQLRTIEKALDLMMRLGLGQVRKILEFLPDIGPHGFSPDYEKLRAHCIAIILDLGFAGIGHSYSVSNKEVPAPAIVAYDIGAVIRNTLASLSDTGRHTAWSNPPLHLGGEPLVDVAVTAKEP